MSVSVITDLATHTLILNVNGAKLTMDLHTAYQVSHFIAVSLDALSKDEILKAQRVERYAQRH